MEISLIYQQLGTLLSNAPDLRLVNEISQVPSETIGWLAKASALVDAMPGVSLDGTQLQLAIQSLIRLQGRAPYPTQIMMILSRALARAELLSPVTSKGAFVSAGGGFDAMASIAKILSSAKS